MSKPRNLSVRLPESVHARLVAVAERMTATEHPVTRGRPDGGIRPVTAARVALTMGLDLLEAQMGPDDG